MILKQYLTGNNNFTFSPDFLYIEEQRKKINEHLQQERNN